jgi:hypothetical protein
MERLCGFSITYILYHGPTAVRMETLSSSWPAASFLMFRILSMPDEKSDALSSSQQRQSALSRWDNEGGAGPYSSRADVGGRAGVGPG